MKKSLLTVVLISLFSMANAQIAKWLINPSYDSIYMAEGIDVVIADSANTKILWSCDGKRQITTTSDIHAFRDDRFVLTKSGTANIDCIINEEGKALNLDSCQIACTFPYYSCGKLLVKNGLYYRFVNKDGSMDEGRYINAFPFSNEYATCQTFMNMEKQKDVYRLLINNKGETVTFSYEDKTFDKDDIEFISSVNDENIAIVVLKHKVYKFNGQDGTLTPVFATEDETNLKNQAKLNGDFGECYTRTDSTSSLTAKCGKTTLVSFEFDNMLKPISFTANDVVKRYVVKEAKRKEFTSSLRAMGEKAPYGICWNDKEMLPPQFDVISTSFGNNVFVKLNGKYGMLEIDKDAKFSLKINKGNDIAFLHQKFETTVRVDLPTYILSDKTYLEINPKYGLELDKTSREKKNTESGNFVEYNCILTIPEKLPDETIEITYPIQVLYNGLTSSVINHKVNAWFYKKYEVDEEEDQRNIEHGTLTFVFNIKNAQLDGAFVKFDVSVTADTLNVQREDKMSETHYKYKVYGLNEGINNVVVQIQEQGCPRVSFPFEVEYHKPAPKTKRAPAEEERVIIRPKPQPKPQPKPVPSKPLLDV